MRLIFNYWQLINKFMAAQPRLTFLAWPPWTESCRSSDGGSSWTGWCRSDQRTGTLDPWGSSATLGELWHLSAAPDERWWETDTWRQCHVMSEDCAVSLACFIYQISKLITGEQLLITDSSIRVGLDKLLHQHSSPGAESRQRTGWSGCGNSPSQWQ